MKDKAFEDLYNKTFQKNLRWITYEYNIPNTKAEDILQDTYIKFYQNYLQTHNQSKSSLITYFTNYLKMEILTYNTRLKKKNKEVEFDINLIAEQDIIEEIELKIEIVNKIIQSAPESIKTNYQLLLMWNDGKEAKQIGEELNINHNTIKTRIKKVRKYICEEYSRIQNLNITFKKTKKKDKRRNGIKS